MTVFLNRDGGRLYAGSGTAADARSSVVASRGHGAVDLPAFAGSDAAWDATVQCVRAHFRPFAIDVVDRRPDGRDWAMVMVGGHPSALGYPVSVGGIAPYAGTPLRDAVAFVFSDNHASRESLCATTAHEIGHMVGLDHTRDCQDVMSYDHCGAKRFVNRDAACGEWDQRPCSDGGDRQNSFARLLALLGPRASAPPTTPTPPEPVPPRDSDGPAVAWVPVFDGSVFPSDSVWAIGVRAADPAGIARVELVWRRGSDTWTLDCDAMPDTVAAACERQGDTVVFGLLVGEGQREYAVRVTDGLGNTTTLDGGSLRFTPPHEDPDPWDGPTAVDPGQSHGDHDPHGGHGCGG